MGFPFSDVYLNPAVRDGYRHENMRLVQQVVVEMSLPSGRLVACNPFVTRRANHFRVCCRAGGPRWSSVSLKSAKGSEWRLDAFDSHRAHRFGYPVDAGTGCFMDIAAQRVLVDAMAKDRNHHEVPIAEMDKTYRHTWSWLKAEYWETNLVAFSSG